jgi:hypothetical protein
MSTCKVYSVLTGEQNPLIQHYEGNLEKLEEFSLKHKIYMGHWKFTCPNPHSGENVYGQRIWGFIIDLDNRTGLFMTIEEYQLAQGYDSGPKAEIPFDKLMSSNPFYDFRGVLTGNRYGL